MNLSAQIENSKNRSVMLAAPAILQRKCACGTHTVAGGDCEGCKKKQIQKKLVVGQSGDAYEREAESMADVVMSSHSGMTTRHDLFASIPTTRVQRNASLDIPKTTTIEGIASSSGRPLDAETRSFMEPHFGHDFSRVRVHTDANSAESAAAVNARAYTIGRDVVFGKGRYSPRTNEGRRLLAHELTHIVQQTGTSNYPAATMQRADDGPLPIVIVSGPAAVPKVTEDAAEKIIRTVGAKQQKAGGYRFVPITGYKDFVSNAHKVLKDKECARKVLIDGHGGSNDKSAWQTMGSATDPTRGWGVTDIGNNAGTLVGADVFKNIKFCKPCEVWLGGCDFAANKPGKPFLQAIANATGCTAKAYTTETTTDPDTGMGKPVTGGGGPKKVPPETP